MIKALRHPFGISLLLASLLLAGLGLSLDRWSGQAIWMALLVPLGLLAYAASVATVHRYWPVAPLPAAQVEISASLVHKVLKNLNKPASLSKSELVALLAATLTSSWSQANGQEAPADLAPLEQAKALREVLLAAIEQFNTSGKAPGLGAPEQLQYHILHEAFVLRRQVDNICMRYSISEKTYHRNRKDAEALVAHHLQVQEGLIRRGSAKVVGTG